MATAFSSRAHDRSTARRGGDQTDGASVGKRTLIEQLAVPEAAPIQRKLQLGDVGGRGAGDGAAATSPGGAGSALPEQVRAPMERSFGADFSGVRIHQDASAEAMGASAYARGDDIHFAPGQYDPESERGRELLGHELSHVVQQRQGRVQATAQAKGVALNDDPALEREADHHGARAARGEPVATHGAAATAPASAAGPVQRTLYKADGEDYEQGECIAYDEALRDGHTGLVYRYVSSYPGEGKIILRRNANLHAYSFATDAVTAYDEANHELGLGYGLARNMMAVNNSLGAHHARGVHYEHTYQQQFPEHWQDHYLGGYANPQYFIRVAPMHWRLIPGERASLALQAWLDGLTIAECATTLVVLQLKQLLQVVGPAKFDRMFGGADVMVAPTEHLLEITNDISQCVPQNLIQGGGQTNTGEAALRPGAKYFFQNHSAYHRKHPDGALGGENSVYVGNQHGADFFAGFGIGPVTARRMCEILHGAYNRDRTEGDYRKILVEGSNLHAGTVDGEAQAHGYHGVYQNRLHEVHPYFRFGDTLHETLTWEEWSADADVGIQGQGVMLNVAQMMHTLLHG